MPAQTAQHLHPVHLGQVEVQQYKVVPFCRQCFQRGFAICTSVHLVPGQPQLPGNVLPQGVLVLYHQKTHLVFHPSRIIAFFLHYNRL